MKVTVYLTVFFLFVLALNAQTKPQLGRLHYDGGGDWYNDPETLPNLVEFCNENINTGFSTDQAVVKVSDNKISNLPFVFMTGHGNVTFSEKEVENLRSYLQKGGLLYADDDYGMDKSFRREIKKVFPEKELVELPQNHELFNCFFSFPYGMPKTHEHDDKRPQAFAIFDDYGRMMVLYTYESNISDGWASASTHNNPPEVRETALRMGANILYYLITQ